MRKITFICSLAALALVAVGCGDDDTAPAMTDGGSSDAGTDLGPRDMNPPPRPDLGPVDPCAAANAGEALTSFDCNGDVEPPGAANALFGACTEAVAVGDAGVDPAGSCTDSELCFGGADGTPSSSFCLDTCTGATDGLYAQTGDCPAGSRCLTVFSMDGDTGFCVPSCEVDADCASGFCDTSDNSCFFAPPGPPADGGVPTDGGGADGGTTSDAGTDDGGVVDLDAAVGVDAGVDATVPAAG